MPRATVIVCTHNRAEVLRDCLLALARLQPPAGGAEILLVDNASTDATAEVFAAARDGIRIPVRYIREEALGLSNARNRGIAEAKGSVLAFLDDDAVCRPDWLVRLLAVYDEHPDAQCVGGRILLDWRTPPPGWWTDALNHHLSGADYGEDVVRLRYPRYPYGANISFPRAVFDRGLRFDPSLGRRGGTLGAGEEMKLALEIEQSGGAIYYAPRATVYHRAEAARANRAYLFRKSYLHGRSSAQLESQYFDLDRRIRTFSNLLVQGVVQCLTAGRAVDKGCAWRFRAGYVGECLRRCVR